MSGTTSERTLTAAEFAELRAKARTNDRPDHWPADVRCISLEGISLIGLDSKGQLYLDGEQVYTTRRFSNQERAIAWLAVFFTGVAAAAACVSAYADTHQADRSASTPRIAGDLLKN
jgi:Holliday junction resolvase